MSWSIRHLIRGNTPSKLVEVKDVVEALRSGKAKLGIDLYQFAKAEKTNGRLVVHHQCHDGVIEKMKKDQPFDDFIEIIYFNSKGDVISTVNSDGVIISTGYEFNDKDEDVMLGGRIYRMLQAQARGAEPVIKINDGEMYRPMYAMGPLACVIYLGMFNLGQNQRKILSPTDCLARAQMYFGLANPKYLLTELKLDFSYSFVSNAVSRVREELG